LREFRAGEAIAPLEQEITLPMMVAYAGATWDWHRYHYDLQLAHEMGLPAPFVDGQMLGGLLAKMLLRWAGPEAMLRRLWLRYRALLFPGESIACTGVVEEVRQQGPFLLLVCRLEVRAGDGRPVVDQAGAEVEVPAS
jgi:acyl dehydratase